MKVKHEWDVMEERVWMGQAVGVGKASPPSISLHPEQVSRQTHDGGKVGLAGQRINLVMHVVLVLPGVVLLTLADRGVPPLTPYNGSCLLQLMLPSTAQRGTHEDRASPLCSGPSRGS